MPRVVVVGAGAAGTMAAIFAAGAGAETVLLERTKDGGRKILISGGGRCNILPSQVDEARFVTDSSPHTLRHIVRSWPLREQIAFFENQLDLPLIEEPASAKLFPKSQSARDVRDKLLAFAVHKGVRIVTDTVVTGFAPHGSGWLTERQGGEPFESGALVVATGGLSVPHTGSDGGGLRIAAQLGHSVVAPYAALTPLTSPRFAKLSGISLPVTLTATAEKRDREGFSRGDPRKTLPIPFSARSSSATGGFLFTHNGYSGPAVLDVSHVAVRSLDADRQPARVTVQWTPLGDSDWEAALRASGARTVLAALNAHLPARLAEALIEAANVEPARSLSHLSRDERGRLVDTLVRGDLPWSGHEGYKKAEVTGGGVHLAEVDSRTMESRRHPGLFLCGEMLDAFGPIGGYNFLWAWVTGRAAGLGAAANVGEGG